MAKYKTTITKKDGSTASGYIENDKGYYDDGTTLSAGDSIIDAQNKVWTKGGSSGSGSSDPDAGLSIAEYGAKHGVSIPSGGSSSSGRGSYKVTGIDKPSRTGYLRSAKELADLYDINYDMDAIKKIYDDATNAKYALLSKELEQGENDFYTNNAQANATLLDTLRKATSSAIATGASRGIAGAEKLGLMMEQQQAITEGATNLAQERANMADKIAAEKAENIINALEYSDNLKKTLGNLSSNIYSADTQYDVGLLDWAAQMKNVEALFEQIGAEERANLAALLSNEKIAQAQREHEAAEGKLDRDAQKAINDATIAGNLEAARIQAAGYRTSGGGYGGYGSQLEGDDWDKIWNKGDRNQAIKYLREHWGMTWQEANDKLNADQQFLLNEKYRGYSNIPSHLMNKGNVKIITNKTATDIAKDAAKNNIGSKKDIYNITYEKDGSQTVWYRDGSYAIIPADLGKKEKTDYSHLSSIPAQFTARPSK